MQIRISEKSWKKLSDIHFYFDMDGTANEWDLNGDPHMPHYFRNRPLIKSTIESMLILQRLGYNVAFATSVYQTDEAMLDKRLWANDVGCENIPIIYIPYGQNKDEYLTGKVRILIDDHTPNLNKFSGVGVKFINQINHTGGKWQGPSVSYKETGTEIASKLLTIAINSAME